MTTRRHLIEDSVVLAFGTLIGVGFGVSYGPLVGVLPGFAAGLFVLVREHRAIEDLRRLHVEDLRRIKSLEAQTEPRRMQAALTKVQLLSNPGAH